MTLIELREKGCLSNWFPVIEAVSLPVPKTRIIRTDCDFDALLDGEIPKDYAAFLYEIVGAVQAMGLPCFLRTGQTSGKHDWKDTCLVTDLDRVESHIFNLVEHSALVDLAGLATNVWAVRELLPVKPAFFAFEGEMPIAKERRFFVRGEEVLCAHPYWPKDCFEDRPVSDRLWPSLLFEINEERLQDTIDLFTLSRRVGRLFDGIWSVDWLWTERGWFLTDMAPAEISWHWPGCVNEGLCLI